MTRIMRLVNTNGDSIFLVDGGILPGIDWMDDVEVINMLTKGRSAKIADVHKDLLSNDIFKDYFDLLWCDEGSIDDFRKAFETLFSICEGELS